MKTLLPSYGLHFSLDFLLLMNCFGYLNPLQTRNARGGTGSNRAQRFEPGWVRLPPLVTHPPLIRNLSVLTIALLAACGEPVDLARETEKLLQTDRDFSKSSQEIGAPDAFYRYMIDDALQLPHGGNPVIGRDSIRAQMSDGPEVQLTWTPEEAEVALQGDLGYTWGNYLATWKDAEGITQKGRGKYLNIWKKQADGEWKVAVDMGNHNPRD